MTTAISPHFSFFTIGSFTDQDRKTITDLCSMYEKIKGKKLKIYFKNGSKQHYITYSKHADQFTIFTDPNDPKIDPKTAFEHEGSHYLHDTPFKTIMKILNDVVKNLKDDLKSVGKDSFHAVHNILEDQRIESLTGSIQLGSLIRFIALRKKLGSDITEIKDPINALLASRFFRDDLINNTQYEIAKDYIKQAEFLDPKGCIVLAKKYFDLFVIPYLNSLPPNKKGSSKGKGKGSDKEDPDNKDPSSKGKGKGKGSDSEDPDSEDPDSEDPDSEDPDSEDPDSEDPDSEDPDSEDPDSEDPDSEDPINEIDQLQKSLDKILENSEIDFDSLPDPDLKIDLDNIIDLDKEIIDSIKRQEKITKDLKDKIRELTKGSPDNFSEYDKKDIQILYKDADKSDAIELNNNLASRLTRIFKQANGKTKLILSDVGSEIDIESFIEAKVKGNNEIMYDSSKTNGLTIVILHDVSSSMIDESKIKTSSSLCATFFKSIQQLRDVKLKVICYSSDNVDLNIMNVNNINQCGSMLKACAGNTPTHWGIREAYNQLKNIRGKKLLVILTDGMPNQSDNYSGQIENDDLIPYSNYLVNKIKSQLGVNVYGILIGSEINSPPHNVMTQIFKDNFTSCIDIDTASKELTDIFSKAVKGYLS